MSLTLGDNFSYQASKPLDARLKYDTVAAMKAVGDSTMYEGCLAYCVATDKTYQWKSTNTVDTDLGKWREFSSGGGGGHAIEDSEGTTLTQRDTMQFGDGFNATDDSENEKTVVEPNLMTAADMDDVVTPLPSVRSRYHKYSTEEQIVGEWIDGEPLYQRTVIAAISGGTTEGKLYYKQIDVSSLSIDSFISCNACLKGSNICITLPSFEYVSSFGRCYFIYAVSSTTLQININEANATMLNLIKESSAYITIQYTKVTS